MDTTQTHYLTFDPEAIYREMLETYIENGGDILYPGDEKEILLRTVQSLIVQGFAGVDNALRMATLRYAAGDYLDLLGDNRGCSRREAQKAKGTISAAFMRSGITLPAGTRVTADGATFYTVDETITSVAAFVEIIDITAEVAGESGNSLLNGTQMELVGNFPDIRNVKSIQNASGGADIEDDDSYRERIRNFGLLNNTTGPRLQYESRAKAASSEIIDVHAGGGGFIQDGAVYITLLVPEGRYNAIKPLVEAALNAEQVRPLTDIVLVGEAIANDYTLNVQYKAPAGVNIADDVKKAAEEYQKWQDSKIGRAFNPDRLKAALYNLGATMVRWGAGSNFEGGPVEYTEIVEDNCCKGTITVEVIA